MDKDGNELDGECSRPQKHAKSPELAREFLLDAATVIFKEQVEKAFREGTARQNAHSIFVCLALKLLEDRVHVACKEIITLEKQMKLLEEEEKEKREEEERKERRRTKEREKKLRRKERLKGKGIKKGSDETSPSVDEELNATCCGDSISETGDISLSRPGSPDVQDQQFSYGCETSIMENDSYDSPDGEIANLKEGTGSFSTEQSKYSRRRLKFRKEVQLDSSLKWPDRRRFAVISESGAVVNRSELRHHSDNFETPSRPVNGLNRLSRVNGPKSNGRNCGLKFNESFHCPHNRMNDRYDFHSCSCHQNIECRVKVESHVSSLRVDRESKPVGKSETMMMDMSKQFYRGNKYTPVDYMREGCGRIKSKSNMGNNSKKVWEPVEAQKKYSQSSSDYDITMSTSTKVESVEPGSKLFKSSDTCSSEVTGNSIEVDHDEYNNMKESRDRSLETVEDCQSGCHVEANVCYSTETAYEEVSSCPAKNAALSETSDPSTGSTLSSDNCSSCLSEGDSNTVSSNNGHLESSSTSDSEDASQQSEGRDTSTCSGNGFSNSHEVGLDNKPSTNGAEAFGSRKPFELQPDGLRQNSLGNQPSTAVQNPDNGIPSVSMGLQNQIVFPPIHNNNLQFPMFQAPSTMGYYHQTPVSWPAAPANGLMPFPQPNHYLYASPLGYGLNGNSRFCMQYGPVQHLATPVFNPGPVPVYQPVAKEYGLNSEVQTETRMMQETSTEANKERMVPLRSRSTEAPPSGEGGKVDNSAKLHNGDSGFSLFHFGGPVALSTGCKSDPVPSKDGIVGDFSSKVSADQIENDPACNKKETAMEEYNLFAASNGISATEYEFGATEDNEKHLSDFEDSDDDEDENEDIFENLRERGQA
ncbi:unnamed protein product [Dovyalis caffra]|uniref:Uncharacterized protein n=1 Tax=Dovyalis caffra TaxID=77055 RepID=A0AAV1RY31_9ROSI|nr:unnamed protein product [Dovyalis caffra]